MEGLKKYDSQCQEGLSEIRLMPDDHIVLDVRKKRLGVGRINGSETSALMYNLHSTDCALELYTQLRDAKKSGKLKHVTII